jgi:ribosomal protein L29
MKEMRDLSSDERLDRLDQYRTELQRLRTMTGAGGTVENPARIKTLRKAIAKLLTVEHEENHGIRAAASKKTEPKKSEPKKAEPKKKQVKKKESAEEEAKKERTKSKPKKARPKKEPAKENKE